MTSYIMAVAKASNFIRKVRGGLLDDLRSKTVAELNKLEREACEAIKMTSNPKDRAEIMGAIGAIGIERHERHKAYAKPEQKQAVADGYKRTLTNILTKGMVLQTKAGREKKPQGAAKVGNRAHKRNRGR